MQKARLSILNTILILFSVLSVFSCSDDMDMGNLSDTLFVRHKNADMPAYIYGNGSEKIFLITLHGGPGGLGLGFRGNMFKEQIEKKCAVVYFDQRGSGMSQGSYSVNGISIDIMAEDVLALVKVIKKKYGNDSRFFLLGHSYGGTIGTAALLKDQNEFLGWIEIGGSNYPGGVYFANLTNFERVANEQIALGNGISYWESVKALLLTVDHSTNTNDDARKINQEAFNAEKQLVRDGVINKQDEEADILFVYNPFTANWNTGTIQSIEQSHFENVNYNDRLSEITIPSIFLWGKYDMVVPTSLGQVALDNIGSTQKELVLFERSGHSPLASEADRFAEIVIQFIDQNQ